MDSRQWTRSDGDRGFALILVLFFVIVVAALVTVGTTTLSSNRKATEVNFQSSSQALQFARSGLTEAATWFRRQTSQPVTDFEPRIDQGADPPILDTDDPDIGIMREFEIAGGIWGRYEVWKPWSTDPDPQRLAFRQIYQCEDVSAARLSGGPGAAWVLRSIGYVFRQVDPNVPFDRAPNHVIAIQALETEIARLRLAPPGQAAVSIRVGADATVSNMGRIRGGASGAGIYFPQGTGTPSIGDVTGTPALSPSSTYSDTPRDVFGMAVGELRVLADVSVSDPREFPSPIATNQIIVSDAGNLKFDGSRPLTGTGIVYVRGDVTIAQGSNSSFSGLLYVDGDLSIREPAEITGAVVVTGKLILDGQSDRSTIYFDEDVLNALRQVTGQYRVSGPTRPVMRSN